MAAGTDGGMIIDMNAFTGHWPFSPVQGDLPAVRASLRALGVERICVSPLAAAGGRHPGVAAILGGARTGEFRALRERLRALPHFYADVSQSDGLDAVRLLVETGLGDKLLFGSHAPLFMPHAALARVVIDLADADAAAILGGNAAQAVQWESQGACSHCTAIDGCCWYRGIVEPAGV